MVRMHTLCWDCRKAIDGCCWSDHWQHTPVPGWTAVETLVRMNNDTYARSYIVQQCPEFERDAFGGGLHRISGEERRRNGK